MWVCYVSRETSFIYVILSPLSCPLNLLLLNKNPRNVSCETTRGFLYFSMFAGFIVFLFL